MSGRYCHCIAALGLGLGVPHHHQHVIEWHSARRFPPAKASAEGLANAANNAIDNILRIQPLLVGGPTLGQFQTVGESRPFSALQQTFFGPELPRNRASGSGNTPERKRAASEWSNRHARAEEIIFNAPRRGG